MNNSDESEVYIAVEIAMFVAATGFTVLVAFEKFSAWF